jgi:hypothetical protein
MTYRSAKRSSSSPGSVIVMLSDEKELLGGDWARQREGGKEVGEAEVKKRKKKNTGGRAKVDLIDYVRLRMMTEDPVRFVWQPLLPLLPTIHSLNYFDYCTKLTPALFGWMA